MYSTDGSLLSTLMVPDDSELAIFSDSSRTTPELTEFRGTIKIRSKPVKRGDTTPHRQRPSDFDGAPIQIDLTDTDVSFVIVRHYDCSKVTE